LNDAGKNNRHRRMINNQKPIGIQSGAVTHHHDHAITLVSLRIRNTTKRIVPSPIELPEFEFAIIF
jgi:hypothetical protein